MKRVPFPGEHELKRLKSRKPYVDGTLCTLPFGKYKGNTFEDTPPWYLNWLSLQPWVEWKFPRLYSQLISYLADPAVARVLQAERE